MLELHVRERIAILRLNDPEKRNALSLAMFDALDGALDDIQRRTDVQALLLTGSRGRADGKGVFCAGFDLAAAAKSPELIAVFIARLSTLNRRLRRMEPVAVAAVHGAAIAGGCAMLTACDFVIAAPDARLGYPVHSIGISPAVTIPTLQQVIASSQARALLMSGELIDARRALEIGLITHVAQSPSSLDDEAMTLVRALASKPPRALAVTKAWLNELDGSLHDDSFDATASDSAAHATTGEARALLREYWRRRSQREREK